MTLVIESYRQARGLADVAETPWLKLFLDELLEGIAESYTDGYG